MRLQWTFWSFPRAKGMMANDAKCRVWRTRGRRSDRQAASCRWQERWISVFGCRKVRDASLSCDQKRRCKCRSYYFESKSKSYRSTFLLVLRPPFFPSLFPLMNLHLLRTVRSQAVRSVIPRRAVVSASRSHFFTTSSVTSNPATASQRQSTLRPNTNSRLPRSRIQARHCSHRRMCRRDADAMGANLDIAKGREVLPKNVKPLHYHLTLEPNLETFEYEGKVVIEYVPLIFRLQYVL
jgi:hypothetical protein